jgi:hypothetical protein
MELWLSLGDQDTSAWRMESALQRSYNRAELTFSRRPRLDSAFLSASNCFAEKKQRIPSEDGENDQIITNKLTPKAIYQAQNLNVALVLDSLQPDSSYTFRCLAGFDSLGRRLDTAGAFSEIRWAKMDTASVRIAERKPVQGATAVPPDAPIVLTYSEPVSADTLQDFRLVSNQDTIPHMVRQVDAVRIEVRGASPWSMDATVRLLGPVPDSAEAAKGRPVITQFETVQKLRMANLKGVIPGGDSLTVVRLESLDRAGETREERCGAGGNFAFENLLAGHYRLLYFRDTNGDGKLGAGNIWTLEGGEPWRLGADDLVLPAAQDNELHLLVKDLLRLE